MKLATSTPPRLFTFVVLGILLVLSLAQAQTIRIGAVASATGGASALGEPEANTFRMLQEQLNESGGIAGHPVEIVFLDDATDTQRAVTNVNRLINEDEVHVVICCTISANSLAIIDTLQRAEVPNISMAAAAAIIEPVEERHWIFKVPQTDRLMIGGIVEDMQERGVETVAFMGLDDAYGEGGLVELREAVDGTGIEVVTEERYGRNDTNVTAQTLRVTSRRPDAVLVWGVVRDTAMVVQALRDRNYQGQIYVSHGVGNPSFLELAGEAANGVRFPIGPMIVVDELTGDNPIKAEAQKYIEAYESRYGEGTASTFGGHAYDAIKALRLAFENLAEEDVDFADVEATRAALRDELEEMPEFVGVGGVFDWTPQDHLGLDERALVMVEVEDGEFTLAD
ncbi:MAG TPA: ABC transporter substrate-binding protein [Trueperaceae bacterium]